VGVGHRPGRTDDVNDGGAGRLDPERIMSVHSLNPDRLTNGADIRASL
jgi:hypothetical protein